MADWKLSVVWYQLNRDVTLDNGESKPVQAAPPAGKWTRTESKQNWVCLVKLFSVLSDWKS